MVVARLHDVLADPRLATALSVLVPPARLDAFAASAGVDLRDVPTGVAAGYSLGTLYAAETPWDNAAVERKFAERLTDTARVASTHPAVRRLSGVHGSTPETLVRVQGELVAVAVGDPTPARALELLVEGKLQRSPAALGGRSLATLPPLATDAAIRAYAAGPFTGDWAAGARGLFGAALAAGATVAVDRDVLRVRLVLSGDWLPEDGGRLEGAWADLAASPLGGLLALDRPAAPPVVTVDERALALSVSLPVAPLLAGLHAAVAADVAEFLPAPPPSGPAARPEGGRPPEQRSKGD